MKLFEAKNWHTAQTFLILFLIFLAGLSSGYVWRMIHELKGNHPMQYVYNVPESMGQEHDRKVSYHGLFNGQAVFQDSLGWYFIRDGKRCPF